MMNLFIELSMMFWNAFYHCIRYAHIIMYVTTQKDRWLDQFLECGELLWRKTNEQTKYPITNGDISSEGGPNHKIYIMQMRLIQRLLILLNFFTANNNLINVFWRYCSINSWNANTVLCRLVSISLSPLNILILNPMIVCMQPKTMNKNGSKIVVFTQNRWSLFLKFSQKQVYITLQIYLIMKVL